MFLTEFKTKKQRDAFLAVVESLMKADKKFHKKEKVLLAQYKREFGLGADYMVPDLAITKALSAIAGKKAQRCAYIEWLALAQVDGAVSEEEFVLLKQIGETFGISAEEARGLKTWLAALNKVYAKGLALVEG